MLTHLAAKIAEKSCESEKKVVGHVAAYESLYEIVEKESDDMKVNEYKGRLQSLEDLCS